MAKTHNNSLIALIEQQRLIEEGVECACGEFISKGRSSLGFTTCLVCGEKAAKQVAHTIVPMPKSNYIVVTDMELLKGLNSSHKGVK